MNLEISVASAAVAILADTPAEFQEKIEKVKPFAKRVHIDVADGVFVDRKTVGLSRVYGVDGAQLDLHLMVRYPDGMYEDILTVEPNLVTCHFESDGDVKGLLAKLREVGIKAGLAIKPDTTIEQVRDWLPDLDHLLIFTGGHLGYGSGDFLSECLTKIGEARNVNPSLEISVDGGINQENGRLAVDAGADLLISGSFILESPDPEAAYLGLNSIAETG
jgi:ribulose-phosphate 3-epimerase